MKTYLADMKDLMERKSPFNEATCSARKALEVAKLENTLVARERDLTSF